MALQAVAEKCTLATHGVCQTQPLSELADTLIDAHSLAYRCQRSSWDNTPKLIADANSLSDPNGVAGVLTASQTIKLVFASRATAR